MTTTTLPLEFGASGDDVVELHKLLTIAGYRVETLELDQFGDATESVVRAFQRRRGFDETGVVDDDTCDSLVEAGHHFGARLMCFKTPMMRGDDIAELQLMLGSLGFDAGWIDGIFGPDTEIAVADFQRNAGLPVDGVAGPTTCETLTRLRLSANAARPVAAVRERELLRDGARSLVGTRVVVGDLGLAPTIASGIGSMLRREGARVLLLHHPDGSTHARAANQFDASLYLGVAVSDEAACQAAFYETDSFSSYGGRDLADLARVELGPVMGLDGVAVGRRHPALRQTRMPAVLCTLGPPDIVSERADGLATALTAALRDWLKRQD